MLSARGLVGLLVGIAVLGATPARAGGDWNDNEIRWQSYQDGLAAAKKEKKPVCLIFYTDWCPHCANYSTVFHDPKVVDMTKHFVMVRLNKDKEKELSKKYAPDGEYIPRTYFLSSAGELDADIHAPRDTYKYFYDEKAPASVLGGMEEASKKLR
ncbi:MAG TPA: thioredoxin family protein [Verrucomicrobiae bacterium]|nr:thioredoxin family protein [Verrucomicrobiae bacterium]